MKAKRIYVVVSMYQGVIDMVRPCFKESNAKKHEQKWLKANSITPDERDHHSDNGTGVAIYRSEVRDYD